MIMTLSRQFVTLTGTGKAVRVFFFCSTVRSLPVLHNKVLK